MDSTYKAGEEKKKPTGTKVPNLMARVKIEREMEALRRERDKVTESLKTERTRAKQSGVPVSDAIVKMLRRNIQEFDDQIEDQIEELAKLEGSSDDPKNS